MPREQERLRKDEDVLCSTAACWRAEPGRAHTHTHTHSINHSRYINTHLLRAVAPPPHCVQELKKQLHINFSVFPSELGGGGVLVSLDWTVWTGLDWTVWTVSACRCEVAQPKHFCYRMPSGSRQFISLVPCFPSCILPPFDHVRKCALVHCSGTHAALQGIDSNTSQFLHSQGCSSL